MSGAEPQPPERAATYREVFAVGEYRAIFGTMVLSIIGDELARVALAVLVYQRTDSPLLSAAVFGTSYLPWLLGGPLLSTLADRYPRRRVMVVTDGARAVLVALLAVPGMPLWLLLALLYLIALGAPPFESARTAETAEVLREGDRYALAVSLTAVLGQLATVAGFTVGGLVAAVDPVLALLLDAATFGVSALWLAIGLHRRPAPARSEETTGSLVADMLEGLRLVLGSGRLRAIVVLLWTGAAFSYAPEGVFTALADELDRGPTGLGLLLAAGPLGTVVGGVVVARLVGPRSREQSVPLLVGLSLAPLAAAGVLARTYPDGQRGFAAVLALLFLTGLGAAWLIPLNQAFARAVPDAYRGRAFGVAVTGLNGAQGLAVLAAGFAAQGLAPSTVLLGCGTLGLLAVALPLAAYTRTRPHVAPGPATAGPSGP